MQDFLRRAVSGIGRASLCGLVDAGSYGYDRIILALIVHCLLGYRRLRESDDYVDDAMATRTGGLKRLPSASTLSRLGHAPTAIVERLRGFPGRGVIEPIRAPGLRCVTLDFDGSVQSTRRRAEGTAVGCNSRRKGERSYCPLPGTVARLGQVFDVLHRPGNVHDSRGARERITASVERIRGATPGVCASRPPGHRLLRPGHPRAPRRAAGRVHRQHAFHPLARDQARKRWGVAANGPASMTDATASSCPGPCVRSPGSSLTASSSVRRRVRPRDKGPLQLGLFEPVDPHYTFKAIVTNRPRKAATVIAFHEGRGEQEGLIGELKSDGGLDSIPAKRLVADPIHRLSGLIAHNLGRELHIETRAKCVRNLANRASLWFCHELSTLRRRLLWQLGRLTRPNGKLTPALTDNDRLRHQFMSMRETLVPHAYSRPRLPLIPDEACHPFHRKAAADSTAKLPPPAGRLSHPVNSDRRGIT